MKIAVIFLTLSTVASISGVDRRFFGRTNSTLLPNCVVEVERQEDKHGRVFLAVIKPDCFSVRWKRLKPSEVEKHRGPASICYCPEGVDCGTIHKK